MGQRIAAALLLGVVLMVAAPARADVVRDRAQALESGLAELKADRAQKIEQHEEERRAEHAERIQPLVDMWTRTTTDGRPLLIDQYPPEQLHFYARPSGSVLTEKGREQNWAEMMSDFLGAVEKVMAWGVALGVRLIEWAWNLNIARLLGTALDSIAGRFSRLMLGFGGLVTALTALWIAIQAWNGAYSRAIGKVAEMVLILGLWAALSATGMSSHMAYVEDLSGDFVGQILAPPGEVDYHGAVNSMTEGIYRQLILDQWARANFRDMETAQRFQKDGIPGGQHWNLAPEAVEDTWQKAAQEGWKESLLPWYDDPIGRRVLVVTVTFFTSLFVMPVLAILGFVVSGFKVLGFLLGSMWPVFFFFALVPWSRGLAFLRSYSAWVLSAPLVKIGASFLLAIWMVFVGAIMDTATTTLGLVGASATIAGFTLVAYFVGRPILRLFAGLVVKTETEKAAERAAARELQATAGERYGSRAADTIATYRHIRGYDMPRPTVPSPQTTYHQTAGRAGGKTQVPELELARLFREATRLVRTVADKAERGGGGKR